MSMGNKSFRIAAVIKPIKTRQSKYTNNWQLHRNETRIDISIFIYINFINKIYTRVLLASGRSQWNGIIMAQLANVMTSIQYFLLACLKSNIAKSTENYRKNT